MSDRDAYPPGQYPDLPPPVLTSGPVFWMRKNLFSGPFNTLMTLLAFYLLYLMVPPSIDWMLLSADWVGKSRDECVSSGACWAIVTDRWDQFIYGFYDDDLRWRPNLAFLLLIPALAPILFDKMPYRRPLLAFSVAYPSIAAWLLLGDGWILEEEETSKFGGLLLTIVIGLTGIALSLPVGILLALGRRSELPAVRILCVLFIEFIRGVPLITLLFMGSVLLPLFLPQGVNFDVLLRILIAVTLFASAYMAEVIRGGLQAIPRGQYEAADAIGLGYWRKMRLIILPQALKISIPGIVNTFIGLFKDTTLVIVVGLLDLLGVGKSNLADIKWIGLAQEVYIFVAIVFFIFCFGMSRYSIWLEDKLHTGHKR